MSTTFKTGDVKQERRKLPDYPFWAAVRKLLQVSKKNQGEAGGMNVDKLVQLDFPVSTNPLIAAAYKAFKDHYALTLAPDDIWLTFIQGLAGHVNIDPEKWRHHFVAHEGKKKLDVRRDGFSKGSSDNDWQGVFAEFSEQIATHIGEDKRDLLVADFTTTGPVEKIASEIVMMDALKAFFSYSCSTLCGIPQITLLGEKKDWVSIRERAAQLGTFGLDWWMEALLPMLDEFVAVWEGKINEEFWHSFIKVGGGSGGPYVSGEVNKLFPYLRNQMTRKFDRPNKFEYQGLFGGPTLNSFPPALSKVPFIWNYYETKYSMEFVGGLIGVTQLEDRSLRPVTGWAVRGLK